MTGRGTGKPGSRAGGRTSTIRPAAAHTSGPMADVSPTGSTTPDGIVELRVHGVSGAGRTRCWTGRTCTRSPVTAAGVLPPRPGYPDSTGPDG
ncbi:hypothetical protein NKG94_11430 [Micromonospora sp. M12]